MSDKSNNIDKPLYVTSPLMPDFREFCDAVRPLWDTRILTNNGHYVKTFEKALGEYLGERYVSVYGNGTLPILAACHALGLKGEVITTPYTFIATSHALTWCGLKPIYIDVDKQTGNMDPTKIEAAITERTCAILPVHVYGRPCDTEAISAIGRKHNLPVVYDAAHAFGVRRNGRSITADGDVVTLSFHATKVFNSIEGGAVICRDAATKNLIDRLRNFGFESETEISAVGINAKLDEMRAIFGLLNLREVDDAINRRKVIAEAYQNALGGIGDISLPEVPKGIRYNYSHYPILLKDKRHRDAVYHALRRSNIFPRRYFYPLVTDFAPYDTASGADCTPIACDMSDRVLCLPLHTAMTSDDVSRISDIVKADTTEFK